MEATVCDRSIYSDLTPTAYSILYHSTVHPGFSPWLVLEWHCGFGVVWCPNVVGAGSYLDGRIGGGERRRDLGS